MIKSNINGDQDNDLILEMRRKRSERRFQRRLETGSWRNDPDKTKQFIPISFMLLDNLEFRNRYMTKKRFRTYLWLRRNVIRGSKGRDPANVY